MHKEIRAKIHKERPEGTYFLVLVPGEYLTDRMSRYSENDTFLGELRIDDGRTIRADQRKKIFATIADTSEHLGYPPEYLRQLLRYWFIAETGADDFSLSNCSVTTARLFLSYIIEFAIEVGAPMEQSALERTDDIGAWLSYALKSKVCAICAKPDADLHHVQAIGMGRDRVTYDDSDHSKISLCRQHHGEAHSEGWGSFSGKWHVYGIVFNE